MKKQYKEMVVANKDRIDKKMRIKKPYKRSQNKKSFAF